MKHAIVNISESIAERNVALENNIQARGLVPQTEEERIALRNLAEQFVLEMKIVPPLSMEELLGLINKFTATNGIPEIYGTFSGVLLNNEVWKSTLASIPFERRMLMIPQCLRDARSCDAEFDEFGLICKKCGNCPIGIIQGEAEKLGYVVLVAEGTTVVTRLLESGKIDGVIGVGCLSVLEKAFAHMSIHAIPGYAIPLNRDGCVRTDLDIGLVFETIKLKSDGRWSSTADIEKLKSEIEQLFTVESLLLIAGDKSSEAEKLALQYLAGNGKRWRPLLAAGIYKAIKDDSVLLCKNIKRIAVAVECFHKASLLHDDIEDADDFRDGSPAFHRMHGIPVALNTGDLLIGLGYNLISECEMPADSKSRMLAAASQGHRDLCIGQGEELFITGDRKIPSSRHLIDIFRHKTSPEFEVALRLGAICAGGDEGLCALIKSYSSSLGTSYQIRDDIADFENKIPENKNMRASIITAITFESADKNDQQKIEDLIFSENMNAEEKNILTEICTKHRALEKASQLCEHYRNEAVRALFPLRNSQLKSFLRRVMGKML